MLNNFYYAKLNSGEQSAYRSVSTALSAAASQCVLYDIDQTSVERVWLAVVLENPEIIYYPGLSCRPSLHNGKATLRFEYYNVDQSLYEYKLNILLQKINKKLTQSSSGYTVCKTIFDVLCATVKYRGDVLDKYFSMKRQNSSELVGFLNENHAAFTPYGVVVNGKGVCQGIAKLFKILCNSFGIECACVQAFSRRARGDEPDHMLNAVEIDGKRYYVDATRGLMHESVPVVRYDFFMCSAETLAREFETLNGPEDCTDDSINYYARKGVQFSSVNAMRKYLCAYVSSFENGEIKLRYDGKDMSDAQLQAFCLEVMEGHCESGKQVVLIAENGFCTGKIFDEAED